MAKTTRPQNAPAPTTTNRNSANTRNCVENAPTTTDHYAPKLIEARSWFEEAANWMYELQDLFDAISKLAPEFSTAQGVASAGGRLAEEFALKFEGARDRFNAEAAHA
ncbi:hypothetical protein [Caballeronia sp. BCC1704]|uniref:hypothetical protein n=1 Tax=Caballeronia sp. BCC1704 TaxID=2676300 RepID=UPI00158883B3|nr:hypothetical protein [Caballeronia sp. BCC1704]